MITTKSPVDIVPYIVAWCEEGIESAVQDAAAARAGPQPRAPIGDTPESPAFFYLEFRANVAAEGREEQMPTGETALRRQ